MKEEKSRTPPKLILVIEDTEPDRWPSTAGAVW
jgi:hypothetical protein